MVVEVSEEKEAVVSVVETRDSVVVVVEERVDSAQAARNARSPKVRRMRIFLMGIVSFHSPVTPVRSMLSTNHFCITAYTRSTGRMMRIVAA